MHVSRLTRCGSLVALVALVGCSYGGGPLDTTSHGAGGDAPKNSSSAGTAGYGGKENSLEGDTALGAQAATPPDACGTGVGSQVARVPENPRTIDSALYALRLLRRMGNITSGDLAFPEPAGIRAGDFLNYYSLPLSVDVGASVEFALDASTNGLQVGTLVARMPAPVAAPFQPDLIVAVDTSVSMVPLLETERQLAIALQESAAEFGGVARLRTWTSPEFDPSSKTGYVVDSTTDALRLVQEVCDGLASDQPAPTKLTHLVLLGDGRAKLQGIGALLKSCPSLRVDAAIIAHSAVPGETSPLEDLTTTYDATALDPISRLGGASILVTDEQGAIGAGTAYPDIELVRARFPSLFGDALESVRVLFEFPSVLAPLSVENPLPPSVATEELSLAPRTVGFDRAISFRQLMSLDEPLGVACQQATVKATIWFKRMGNPTFESLTAEHPLMDAAAGGVNPLRDYDNAVMSFAQTLRTADKAGKSSNLAAAITALSQALASHECSAQSTDVACVNLGEMKHLLGHYSK